MLMLTTGSFNLGMMTALSLLYIHTRQHYHYHFRSGENDVATPHIIIVWSRELQNAYFLGQPSWAARRWAHR